MYGEYIIYILWTILGLKSIICVTNTLIDDMNKLSPNSSTLLGQGCHLSWGMVCVSCLPHDFPIFWLLNPHVFLVNLVALMGETMAKLDDLEPAKLASSWLANPLQHKSMRGSWVVNWLTTESNCWHIPPYTSNYSHLEGPTVDLHWPLLRLNK